MRENVYQHFKFTPKATRQVVAWAVVFPAVIAYASWAYDVSVEWAGERGCGDASEGRRVPGEMGA